MAMHDWNSTDLERMLGQATWEWDAELGMHIPVCSRWKINGRGNVIRCGNGPLAGDQIDVGTCSEGPHLNTHEFDGHRPGV